MHFNFQQKLEKGACKLHTGEHHMNPQQNFYTWYLKAAWEGLRRGGREPWDPRCSQKINHSAEQQQTSRSLFEASPRNQVPHWKYKEEDCIHRPGRSGETGNWHPSGGKVSGRQSDTGGTRNHTAERGSNCSARKGRGVWGQRQTAREEQEFDAECRRGWSQ